MLFRSGSYEPSVCYPGDKITIQGINVKNRGGYNTFEYTCDYDGYQFLEDELSTNPPHN